MPKYNKEVIDKLITDLEKLIAGGNNISDILKAYDNKNGTDTPNNILKDFLKSYLQVTTTTPYEINSKKDTINALIINLKLIANPSTTDEAARITLAKYFKGPINLLDNLLSELTNRASVASAQQPNPAGGQANQAKIDDISNQMQQAQQLADAAPTAAPTAAQNYQLRHVIAQDEAGKDWLFIARADYEQLKDLTVKLPANFPITEYKGKKVNFLEFLKAQEVAIGDAIITDSIVRIPIDALFNTDIEPALAMFSRAAGITIKSSLTVISLTNTQTVDQLEAAAIATIEPVASSTTSTPANTAIQSIAVNYKVTIATTSNQTIMEITLEDYQKLKGINVKVEEIDMNFLHFLKSKQALPQIPPIPALPTEAKDPFLIPIKPGTEVGQLLQEFANLAQAQAHIKFNDLNAPAAAPVSTTQNSTVSNSAVTTTQQHQASVTVTPTPAATLHQAGVQDFMTQYKAGVTDKAQQLSCQANWSASPYTLTKGAENLATLQQDRNNQSITCTLAANLNVSKTAEVAQMHAAGLIKGFKKNDPITLTFAGDATQAKVLAETMLKEFHGNNPHRQIAIACADQTLKNEIEAIKTSIYTAPTVPNGHSRNNIGQNQLNV